MSVSFGEWVTPGAVVAEDVRAHGVAVAASIPQPSMENGGFREAARWWAYWVGNVFPLSEASADSTDLVAGKVPHGCLGRGWTAESIGTRDLEEVASLWKETPLANVGITTRASGILILDVDPRNNGWANVRAWCAANGVDLSRVPRSVSPRGDGGAHLWFRIPEGRTYPHSPLVKGVDRPWQVPVPPSMRCVTVDADSRDPSRRHGFRPYEWVAGDPRIEYLPLASEPFLAEGVGQSADANAQDGSASRGLGGGGAVGNARIGKAAVDAAAGIGVKVGEQSYTYKRMACSMVRRGYSDQQILDHLLATDDISETGDLSNPWTVSDLAAIVYHARRYITSERVKEQAENAAHAAVIRKMLGLNR